MQTTLSRLGAMPLTFVNAIQRFFAFASHPAAAYISFARRCPRRAVPGSPTFQQRSALMTFRLIFPYFLTILAKHSLPNITIPASPQDFHPQR